jgi:hypothetical protein
LVESGLEFGHARGRRGHRGRDESRELTRGFRQTIHDMKKFHALAVEAVVAWAVAAATAVLAGSDSVGFGALGLEHVCLCVSVSECERLGGMRDE